MSTTIEAVFDGVVFRPSTTISLKPNTHVKINIERIATEKPASFFKTARSLNLDGPPDWSANIK